MKHRNLILSTLFMILLLLIGGIGLFKLNFFKEIKFETVGSYDCNKDYFEDLAWFTLRDASYNGFFPPETLDSLGVVDHNISFDYDNYTYVVTVRHELSKISYSYSQTKNRKLIIIPKQFVGNVELKKGITNKVFIYRIKKMDIDCDYHETSRGVSYI